MVIAAVIQPKLNHINTIDYNYSLQEAINLTTALNLTVKISSFNTIKDINPAYFLTKGFLETLKLQIEENECEVVIINYEISAIQQRNLEIFLKCKVLDRTNLIINIFALRAISSEGKLQAELALLLYQKSRLVKAWSHLERQRGGGGFIGGPGETQKELDKRMINTKIEKIKQQLIKLKLNRSVQKNKRNKKNYKTIVLVGYTNSGKSTLFNLLTNSSVLAKDMLFATLDPTTRIINLAKNINCVLIDTVGFITNLPHQLVESFHSTLDVIIDADLIIHLIDGSNNNYLDQIAAVKNVLYELNLNEEDYTKKTLEVFNKVDQLSPEKYQLLHNYSKNNASCLISATNNMGIDTLKQLLLKFILQDYEQFNLKIKFSNYNLINFINSHCVNLIKKDFKTYSNYSFYIPKTYLQQFNLLLHNK